MRVCLEEVLSPTVIGTEVCEDWDFGVTWHRSHLSTAYARQAGISSPSRATTSTEVCAPPRPRYQNRKEQDGPTRSPSDVGKVAAKRPALNEFLRFLQETGRQTPVLEDYSPQLYHLASPAGTPTGDILLVDAGSLGGNWVALDALALSALFAPSSQASTRFFFIGARRQSILEVRKDFFLWFLRNQGFGTDAAAAGSSLADLASRVASFRASSGVPVGCTLTAHFHLLDVIVNFVGIYPFSNAITAHVTGAWRRPGKDAPYAKVFPISPETLKDGEGDGEDNEQD